MNEIVLIYVFCLQITRGKNVWKGSSSKWRWRCGVCMSFFFLLFKAQDKVKWLVNCTIFLFHKWKSCFLNEQFVLQFLTCFHTKGLCLSKCTINFYHSSIYMSNVFVVFRHNFCYLNKWISNLRNTYDQCLGNIARQGKFYNKYCNTKFLYHVAQHYSVQS